MNTADFRGASLGDYSALVRLLEARRQEMLNDVQRRLRDARQESTRTHDISDTTDTPELDGRDDIQMELIRMKAHTLHQIDDALSRIHQGTYGCCVGCRQRIAERRLRALPFAARCKDCEEARESTERAARQLAHGSQRSPIAGSAGWLDSATWRIE